MEKLEFREKLFFGTGSFAKDLFMGLTGTYLMLFYTDVFGITAGLAGLVIMITKLIDAFSNPFIGMVVDRTETKYGKYRPYFLAIPIPFAVTIGLMFFTPNLSMGSKFIYALITYNIAGWLFTALDISLFGIVPSITNDLDERSSLISNARIFTSIATLIISTAAMPLVNRFGAGNQQKGFFLLAILVGVVGGIFSLLTFFNTKERHKIKTEPPKFKEYLPIIFGNKGIVSVIVVVIAYALSMGLIQSMGVYYINYYLNKANFLPIYMLMTIAAKVLGSICAGKISAKFGGYKATRVSFIIIIISSVIMFFLTKDMFVIFLLLAIVIGFMTGVVIVTMTAMMANMTDYVEYKNHVRSDGVLFSLSALSIQAGMALSSGVGGMVLQAVGYVPKAVEQAESTMLAINVMRSLVPAVICLLPIYMLRYYPLKTKEDYLVIRSELDKRHEKLTEENNK